MITEEKSQLLSRRNFLIGGTSAAALVLSGCTRSERVVARIGKGRTTSGKSSENYALIYGPKHDEQFPLPAVDLKKVKSKFYRREVANRTGYPAGTVVVDTKNFYLYWTQPGGTAMRYGVGLGRAGFSWNGTGKIRWKQKWPKWTPPAEMIERDPSLEKWSAENGGQPPGLDNALGARALYIFQNGQDTLYRLHGTSQASSIGSAVSSGCVRLLNQDVIDLYNRVPNGSPIVVVQSFGRI
jgi:lipoprotein-anchoring transpeptidase ErfK/SrfK